MKVNFSGYNIYKSKQLKRGLEFVSDYGALFSAGVSATLATVARPIAIYSTPKTDKENKKLACAKSIASSVVGFGLMLGASLPVSRSIKKINKTPEKYLKESTIKGLKENGKSLTASDGYRFATQLFKLGIGAVAAIPKSLITCALIPPIMYMMFGKKSKGKSDLAGENKVVKTKPIPVKSLNFTGKPSKEALTKGIAEIIDNPKVQQFANKHKNSNYPMHIAAITDSAATGAFALQTHNSKKIDEARKRPLINNAIISTGLSILSTYAVDKALDKPANRFIEKFKEANKGAPKLDKYVEGIKIAKPTLLMGGIYYCVIPLISTFFAERVNKK